jgi:S-adenosylmethionine:diacylglycerol 3-amino-3-carboxypropyl transferase
MGANSAISTRDVNNEKKRLLEEAVVHDFKPTSKRGFLERLFAFAFRGFVYPQIWEDPEVDLPALKIDDDSRIMTIASGGCNVMNYLTEGPPPREGCGPQSRARCADASENHGAEAPARL